MEPESNYVTMTKAFKLFWTRYVDFSGRSSRSEYWWWILWSYLISVGLIVLLSIMLLIASLISPVAGLGILIFWVVALILIFLAIIIPSVSLTTRRMRDAGINTGWIIALWISCFIPILTIIARIAMFVISLLPSSDNTNSNNNSNNYIHRQTKYEQKDPYIQQPGEKKSRNDEFDYF